MPTCCPKVRDFARFFGNKNSAQEERESFNMSSLDKCVSPDDTTPQSSGSYHTCTSDLTVDGTSDLETIECLVAADNALRHIREREADFAKVFKRWGIRKSQYALYAGFDEDAIQECTGLLEQIHVVTSARFLASNPLFLSQLGEVLVPFSGVLLTRSFSYFFPAYKFNGNSWEIDTEGDTISHASDRGEGALRLPPVISISKRHTHDSGSSPSGSTPAEGERNSSGSKKDHDPGEDHPLKDDEKPENVPSGVTFHVTSKISFRSQDHRHVVLQKLTTDGALKILIKSDAEHLDDQPASQIKFTRLNFDNDRILNAYKQFQVKVAVDFHERPCPTSKVTPKFVRLEDRVEPVIILRSFAGVTWWEYSIQDLYEWRMGVGMVDWMLPAVDFRKRIPGHIGIEIASYWSILVNRRLENDWICDILTSFEGGTYSNLCQMVSLKIDPAKYRGQIDYRSKLAVDPSHHRIGSLIQHNGSVEVYPTAGNT